MLENLLRIIVDEKTVATHIFDRYCENELAGQMPRREQRLAPYRKSQPDCLADEARKRRRGATGRHQAKKRVYGGTNATSHRRDAPLAEISARVAGLRCRRSRFQWAGARPSRAASRDAPTQLHRPRRQS